MLTGHDGRIASLDYSSDGKLLAAATNRSLFWWDAETGQSRGSAAVSASIVRFSRDGKQLFAVTAAKIRVIDVASGKEQPELVPAGRVSIADLAVSPSGKLLAIGRDKVEIWQIPQARLVASLTRRTRGRCRRASGSRSRRTRSRSSPACATGRWPCGRGDAEVLAKHFRDPGESISSVSFLPGGKEIPASARNRLPPTPRSRPAGLARWNLETGRSRPVLCGAPVGPVEPGAQRRRQAFRHGRGGSFAPSLGHRRPDAGGIASRRQRAGTGRADVRSDAAARAPRSLRASEERDVPGDFRRRRLGRDRLRGSHRPHLAARYRDAGSPVRRPHRSDFRSTSGFPEDKRTITTCSSDQSVRRWDIATGQQMFRIDSKATLQCMSASLDGRAHRDRHRQACSKFFDLETKKSKALTFQAGRRAASPCRRTAKPPPPGRATPVVSKRSAADTGELVRSFAGHSGRVTVAVFAPDGKPSSLLGVERPDRPRLWEADTGRQVHLFEGRKPDVADTCKVAGIAACPRRVVGDADSAVRFGQVGAAALSSPASMRSTGARGRSVRRGTGTMSPCRASR